MHIHETNVDPSRAALPCAERWQGPDQGLIACWERGREKAAENEVLASAARQARPWLPLFGFRFGEATLYRFRFLDPRTGRWVRARYAATRAEIAARYERAEVIGEPEVRRPVDGAFTPGGDPTKA
jgi:hypothetical protein